MLLQRKLLPVPQTTAALCHQKSQQRFTGNAAALRPATAYLAVALHQFCCPGFLQVKSCWFVSIFIKKQTKMKI